MKQNDAMIDCIIWILLSILHHLTIPASVALEVVLAAQAAITNQDYRQCYFRTVETNTISLLGCIQ